MGVQLDGCVVLTKAYKYLAFTVLALIALGGSVRAMNAGLACPDWPLCFGDVIPDYHPQVYFEFIHRVLAGTVSIATLIFAILAFKSNQIPKSVKWVTAGGLALLAAQVILGGLTVLWQLHAKVVAAHLTLGIGFFTSLLWIWFRLDWKAEPSLKIPRIVAIMSLAVLCVLALQVVLGGLVASHYAARVCSDFPKCNGEWIPTLSGAVGLHVLHRFNAYFSFLCVLGFFIFVRKGGYSILKRPATALLHLMVTQIGVGIANVLLLTPPLITVIHLAVGAAIIGVAFRITFLAFYFKTSEYRAAGRERLSQTGQAAYNSH